MLIGFFPFENGDHVGDRLQQDVNSLSFQRRSSGPELSVDAQERRFSCWPSLCP